jgi:hypothetical protein
LLALDITEQHLLLLTSNERKTLCEDTFFIPGKVTQLFLYQVTTLLDGPSIGDTSAMPSAPLPVALSHGYPETDSTFNRTDRTLTSVKADDANIPVYLWNDIIYPDAPPHVISALDTICSWRLCLWQKHLTRDFLCWFQQTHHVSAPFRRSSMSSSAWIDWLAGQDCLRRCMGASWWEWTVGSRPLFWRWPPDY